MHRIIISGTGTHLPERIIDNSYFKDFEFMNENGEKLEKSNEEIITKLEQITGIKERRYIPENENSIPLMYKTAQKTIANAGIDKENLDGIIVAHNAGNMLPGTLGFHTVPNMAALLKHSLEIKNPNCISYDLMFGCPGWIQALIQAQQTLQITEAQHILVLGIEIASHLLDPHDLDSMIMADGCGAVILSKNENSNKGIIAYHSFSHALEDLKYIYLDNSYNNNLSNPTFFKMNGKEVYKYATTFLPQVIKKVLEKSNTKLDEIDMFLFHQANSKMLEAIAHNTSVLCQENEINKNKIPMTISFTGNTSVATIPTMLDMIMKKQLNGFEIKENQKIIFASVGAGMHCNALLYQF